MKPTSLVMKPARPRSRRISARRMASSAMSSTGWSSCAPARPAQDRKDMPVSRRWRRVQRRTFSRRKAGTWLEEAMACLQRTIEFAARLEALPLLGAAKGVRARLLVASGRTGRGKRGTGPSHHPVRPIKNDCTSTNLLKRRSPSFRMFDIIWPRYGRGNFTAAIQGAGKWAD